jgi:hypothetical protein
VTLGSADDLTKEEIIMVAAWLEAPVSLLQTRERGDTDEQALRREGEALGIGPVT